MKYFTEIRSKASPKGEVVYTKKHKKATCVVYKTKKGFAAYIDGDHLDTFRSEKDAVKTIETAIKELF